MPLESSVYNVQEFFAILVINDTSFLCKTARELLLDCPHFPRLSFVHWLTLVSSGSLMKLDGFSLTNELNITVCNATRLHFIWIKLYLHTVLPPYQSCRAEIILWLPLTNEEFVVTCKLFCYNFHWADLTQLQKHVTLGATRNQNNRESSHLHRSHFDN